MKPAQLPKIRAQLEADLGHRLALINPIAEGIIEKAAERALDGADLEPYLALKAISESYERIPHADLYLTSEPMAKMAVDAARDVPVGQRLCDVWPSRHGIMAFDGGLPALPETDHAAGAIPEVLTWFTNQDTTHLALWARSTPEARQIVPSAWMKVQSCDLPSGLPELENGRWESLEPEWDTYFDATLRMLSLALSTWHLMQIPTVAQTITRTEAGPKLRSGKRDNPREVKVIDLRRLARKPSQEDSSSEEGEKKRTYTHQWVVRGHWRQQPVGKDRAERRTTWVPSYLKGPEGAPFLPSETVFVWRR